MGLLGLAFHPNYEENGYFYLNYNIRRGNTLFTIIARMSVDSEDPNLADPSSEITVMEFVQPFANHDGGQIAFGPDDGHLYIATGDGGLGDDPLNAGQDLRSVLGKILRIDVDNPDEGINYGIPETNPFANNSHYRGEIWAWGLRNPWRFSFDPPTGRLWTADVGQNRFEEIDIIEKGGNYGWRVTEGWHCANPSNNCDSIGLIGPVWEYGRSAGNSVTGGFVYRGSNTPEIEGLYIYADFGSGRIWGLDYKSDDDVTNILIEDTDLPIATFGIDENNELFIGALNGKLYKLEDPSGSVDDPEEAGAMLHPAVPNPATDRVTIPYEIMARTKVSLALYNAIGEKITQLVEGVEEKGKHDIEFDTTGIPAGVYYARLSTGQGQISRKVTVIK